MHFLPDMYVPCDVCHGLRYNQETLDIRYRGRNISEVLDLTVAQALDYFEAVPTIARKLHTLAEVGLRSEEHTSELQSLMRSSYAVFCLKKKKYHKRA